MIKAVGFEQIGHISFLVLIYLENNINLKDDLTLDGPLLQLAYQILLTSIVDTKSLETLQNAIAVLCSLPLSQSTQKFVDKKLEIIIDETILQTSMAERVWISS